MVHKANRLPSTVALLRTVTNLLIVHDDIRTLPMFGCEGFLTGGHFFALLSEWGQNEWRHPVTKQLCATPTDSKASQPVLILSFADDKTLNEFLISQGGARFAPDGKSVLSKWALFPQPTQKILDDVLEHWLLIALESARQKPVKTLKRVAKCLK